MADAVQRNTKRIYLDHAATSWPKSQRAIDAAMEFISACGATSGRGAYASARTADSWLVQARHQLSKLVEAGSAADVAFCSSGTHALNAAIFGLVRPNDHIVCTAIEHNSVLRPLEHLKRTRGVEVTVIDCDANGLVDLQAARLQIRENTRAVFVNHASNVTGCQQDIVAWSQLVTEVGAFLVVDASQTLGYVPVNMQALGIDVLVAAGHKGLRAMAGSGLIVANDRARAVLRPLMLGGTGTASEQSDYEPSWPQTVEVGNLNLPAVISMAVAAEEALRSNMESWRKPLTHFLEQLRHLEANGRIKILGHSDDPQLWLPIVSVKLEDWDIHEAAAVLDANFGIETRAGFHCAARIHQALGCHSSGGTLRLSLGHSTTLNEIDEAAAAMSALVNAQ